MIYPIEVTEDGVIVTGESRWRAAKIAGLKNVPVKILGAESLKDVAHRQMSENLHREAMNPVDIARQITKTKAERGWTYQKTAEHYNIPLGTLNSYVSILGLPEYALDAVARGKVNWPSAASITPLKDDSHIKWMIDELSHKRIRSHRIAQLLQRYLLGGGDFKKAKDLVLKTPTEAQAYKLLDSEGFTATVRSSLKRGNHLIDLGTELMLTLKAMKLEDVPPLQISRLCLTLVALQKEMNAFTARAKSSEKQKV